MLKHDTHGLHGFDLISFGEGTHNILRYRKIVGNY